MVVFYLHSHSPKLNPQGRPNVGLILFPSQYNPGSRLRVAGYIPDNNNDAIAQNFSISTALAATTGISAPSINYGELNGNPLDPLI